MSELLPILAVILIVMGLIEKKLKFPAAKRAEPSPQEAAPPIREQAAGPAAPRPAPAVWDAPPVRPAPPKPLEPRADARPASEGEDPGHAYMLNEPRLSQKEPPETEEEERAGALGRELVRGMVLGEIMRRPERRPWGRRRA